MISMMNLNEMTESYGNTRRWTLNKNWVWTHDRCHEIQFFTNDSDIRN